MFKVVGSVEKASMVAAWCQAHLGTRWNVRMNVQRWDAWDFSIDDPKMLDLAILKFGG